MIANTGTWGKDGLTGFAAVRRGPSSGSVLRVTGAELPYTAVLTHPNGLKLYQSFQTMREAETFIRRNTPVPTQSISTLYDQPAD